MVPRKVGTSSPRGEGTTWEVAAPAKLNLYLEVLGKRPDGFHELETLISPVRIYDSLRWLPAARPGNDGCSLSIDQIFPSAIPLDCEDNLVIRAARLVGQRAGMTPHGHFHLTKRIPSQAGMGGGSSDAAAALVLANECWNAGLSRNVLRELASELGSDVPFFLESGTAICRGRGERVERIATMPRLDFVVVKPDFGLPTPRVFAELGEKQTPTTDRTKKSAAKLTELLASLSRGAFADACQAMTNRLEDAAVRLAPEIPRIKTALARAGCRAQFMTGSGSTVVGVTRSAIQARRIARVLSAQQLGTVLATASTW